MFCRCTIIFLCNICPLDFMVNETKSWPKRKRKGKLPFLFLANRRSFPWFFFFSLAYYTDLSLSLSFFFEQLIYLSLYSLRFVSLSNYLCLLILILYCTNFPQINLVYTFGLGTLIWIVLISVLDQFVRKHGFGRDRATERATGVVGRRAVESGRWSEPGGSDRVQGRLPGDYGLLPRDLPLRRAVSSRAATNGRSSPPKLRQLHRKLRSFFFFFDLLFWKSCGFD